MANANEAITNVSNRKGGGRNGWVVLLLRGVLNELNTLLDVALKALDASFQESLLLVGDTVKDVTGLLGTVGL